MATINNAAVQAFIDEWAKLTTPAAIEVIDSTDEQRLIGDALAAGELLPVEGDRYYTRSHPLDTARSEERTVVATSTPTDQGIYNNWRDAEETLATLRERMRGQLSGKTMYVIPYLMAVPGTPVARWGLGVQLSDNRVVALQMMRMARVGIDLISPDATDFVRGVHVTGDLDALGQGTDEDQRLFATIADQRLIVHFGSAYGGNALLGKIAHALRLASYDGWTSGELLAEQFLLLAIRDKIKGETFHVVGGFPSASGKTNLAMTLAPDSLADRYQVEFYGDDIVWMWPGADGRLWAMNPENGIFGVARDTNEKTNPAAIDAIKPGTGAIFTNVAYNPTTREVWWEGRTKEKPTDAGWLNWLGQPVTDLAPDEDWAHPNARFTTTMTNLRTVAPDRNDATGVPVDAVIFGGRASDREPLIRVLHNNVDGIYDGLTLGAEATFAAEGLDGTLRYDPMSMRPFLSYPEANYAQHWLDILEKVENPPIFAHVNWFAKDPVDGHYRWPGFRENVRALLWLWQLRQGKVAGTDTAIGTMPTVQELTLDGLKIDVEDLNEILRVDHVRWQQEIVSREKHLKQFKGLPEAIWAAHASLKKRLEV